MYLRRNMTPEAAAAVLDMNFRGISAERGYRRFYPAADLTAQLVGLTDLEDQGLSGLELAFDEVLRGSEGRKK
jgi:cell division protein FtsI (penicillin-binding protein 3)